MNAFTSRRAAASCGALALLLGVGALVPLSAQADGLGGLTTAVGTVADSASPSAPAVPTPSSTALSVAGADVTLGSTPTPSTGTIAQIPDVASVGVGGLLGGGATGSGTGEGGGSVGDGSGSSLITVNLGGTGSTTGAGTGTTSTTTSSTSSTTNGGTASGGGTIIPTPAAPVAARVLSLVASPSVDTVYPVKDGYRDDVVFHVTARLSSTVKSAVSGSAVLAHGSTAVTRWTVSQPTQDLRWNGLDHGKLVPGTYVLTVNLTDAAGTAHTTTTKVVASPKRLIASTQKVSALSVSGRHTMAAAARAGLSKGAVTLRLTTVAPKVEGKQFLIFRKGTKQLKVRIKQGTHTTKALAVPKEMTSYTLKHTWKKGQVKLTSIQYTYSYEALR